MNRIKNLRKIILSRLQFSKTLFLICLLPCSVIAQTDPKELFRNCINAMNNVQTARYRLGITERIQGNIQYNEYLVKLRSNPFRVYVFSLTSNMGTEVLYNEGKNKNLAVVNPNRFPWFNLNLSPHSMLIRKNHIYTIKQAGFGYISKMLTHYSGINRNTFNPILQLMSDTIFDTKVCYRLSCEYPAFKWSSYTVQKGETFTTIADKFFLSDYMIMERNGHSSFDELTEGDKIVLPNAFAKKIVLSIDRSTNLPIQQIVYDDKGLFSVIEFKSLLVNPVIKDEEFTTGYKEYGF